LETSEELVTAFLYNDLQKVSADIADSVETSDHSAIQRQIEPTARRAFEDCHGRSPNNTDEDGSTLEQLESLYSNCFLSPISKDAPLTTETVIEIPRSELILPAGYHFEQTRVEESSVQCEDDSPEPAASPETSDETQDAACDSGEPAAAKTRKRGRPKRSSKRPATKRNLRKHKRLRAQQRRRASMCSILGIPWDHYFDLLKRLEEHCLAGRNSAAAQRPASGLGPRL
jgi:hypothetical protein